MVVVTVLRRAVGVRQRQARVGSHILKNRGMVDFQEGIDVVKSILKLVAGEIADAPAQAGAVALCIFPFAGR